MKNNKIAGWIPYKIVNSNGDLECHWLNTFDQNFTHPFFTETISHLRFRRAAETRMSSVSDLAMPGEWSPGLDCVEPTAIIFHVSRCGSTLVTQLLATSAQNIVLPEVPFFDDLLRLPFQDTGFSASMILPLVNAAIRFYSQKRTGKEQHVFIKADSWHVFFYEQLRQLYPTIPFILMYRNPAEVFASHKKKAGMQAVSGLIEPAVFGFKPGDNVPFLPDPYISLVLERYFKKYLQIIETDDNFLLVNYNEGPMAMIERIAAFTNTPLSSDSLLAMEERSRFHSKNPGELFNEQAITGFPPYLNKAMQLYSRLDEKRIAMG